MCNVQHIFVNAPFFPNGDTVSNVDFDHHGFKPIKRFCEMVNSLRVRHVSAQYRLPSSRRHLKFWAKLRRFVVRIHQQTCDHSLSSDMRTILSCNGLWNDSDQQYLAYVVSQWLERKGSSTPSFNRRASISSLDRTFVDVLCIDHFHL